MLPVFVASGCWASSFTQAYRILSATDVSGVFLKTATLNPRKGNGLPNYVREDDATFNRMGLPNGVSITSPTSCDKSVTVSMRRL